MAVRMQQRRGTSEQWSLANPVLGEGEIGWESETNKFKIGDGVNNWSDLSYFLDEYSLGGSLSDYVNVSELGVTVATLDVDGFVPAEQLDIDLTAYYTSSETDSAISTAVSAIPAPDLTGYATETYADTAAANAAAAIVDSSPATLDTLNELAAALGDDPNFATTVTTALGNKAETSHTHLLADVTDVTASATELNYVDGVTSAIQTQLNGKASTSQLALKANIIQPNEVLTANRTITSDDDGKLFFCNGTFTVTFSIGAFYQGSRADFINIGSGVVTFAGETPLTLTSKDSKLTLGSTGSAASIFGYGTLSAYLVGDLA